MSELAQPVKDDIERMSDETEQAYCETMQNMFLDDEQ